MRILIAEDDASLRRVVEKSIGRLKHEVVATADGAAAWGALQGDLRFDLLLLDCMMPGLTGLEVCRKARERFPERPPYIIILSACDTSEDVVAGLAAGADDYMAKPYRQDELLARVAAGQRIIEMRDRLARYAEEMERLAESRARQLLHADRLATLGTLAAGMAHEINNPATFISTNAQILEGSLPLLESALGNVPPEDRDRADMLREELPKALAAIRAGVRRISTIVSGLKTYAGSGVGPKASASVNDCIQRALELCQNRLKYREKIHLDLAPDLPFFLGDAQRIEQVFVNLLINAADAIEVRESGDIWIESRRDGDRLRIRVEDNGPGFQGTSPTRIFEPFFTTKRSGEGTGLGLPICLGIVEEHGGRIRADERPGGGARFEIELPLPGEESGGHSAVRSDA